MTTTLRTIVAGGCLAAASFVAAAQTVAQAPACDASFVPTRLDQKLVGKSDQGVDALRDYVFITRGIYGLSMDEAAARIDTARARQRPCAAAVASADLPR